MTARLVRHGSGAFSPVRHRSGAVSIQPVDQVLEDPAVDTLENEAVERVLRVFGESVVAVTCAEVEDAKSRHPSAWTPRPRPRLHPAPKGTAA